MKIADIEVKLIDSMGTDLSVVNAARVSFEKESECVVLKAICVDPYSGDEYTKTIQVLNEGDRKLIKYLAKHKHFSPFNHAFLSFRIKAPIFVARQLVKHKFMTWNEVSRRYVDSDPEFYIPHEYRAKAENVKQGSSEDTVERVDLNTSPYDVVFGNTYGSFETYKLLLGSGVCAEQARMVLPLNTMTEWIWSGTLGAFADMLRLRLDPHTQYESQIVAQQILKEVETLFPVSIDALLGNK